MKHKQEKHPYFKIEELLDFIDEPIRSGCLRLLEENRELFEHTRGSTNNHQAWEGGYIDHITDAMNIGFHLYDHLLSFRELPFRKSDVLLVVFAHDLEKPWKYEKTKDGTYRHKKIFADKKNQHAFRIEKLAEYGIRLTKEQESGVLYIEGENQDYTNKERVMSPLAAFCHMCDIASARLWFDYPKVDGESWGSRYRSEV